MKRSIKNLTTAIATGAGAALALAACGSGPTADDPVNLEFWGWVPGLEEAVAQWNEENPEIQVSFFRMTGDDGDTIPASIDAGTAPDIVQMSVHSIPGHVVNNRLNDLAEYADGWGERFTESTWASVNFDDGVYAIPQDAGPSGMMYREDLFDEHGIDVPTTWDEYLDAARALQEADPDLYIAQFSPNETGHWIQAVWQNGGTWNGIEDDAWTVNVADEQSQEVAELWQTLLDEDLFLTVEMWTPEYWAEVNDGRIATINYAAWFPVLLEESAASTSGNWRVAPTPNFEGQDSAGESGGSVNVVPTGTEHVEEAVAFIEWLNTSADGLDHLISNGGIFPAAVDGLEHPALLTEREFFGGQVVNEVFADAALKVPATWVDGPTYDLIQDRLQDQFARVANGDQTFSEALEAVHDQTVADLQDMGLSVAE